MKRKPTTPASPKRDPGFRPPRDVKAFWVAPHCGPGTLDPDEGCGFCGRPGRDCAAATSDLVATHPDWLHDGSLMGDGHDDPRGEMACGGVGFWCSGCGRFWANDSCGEAQPGEMYAADGARQVVRDGKVYCVCGRQLVRLRTEPAGGGDEGDPPHPSQFYPNGSRVVLRATDELPEEAAVVEGYDPDSDTYVVRVTATPGDPLDDGLREVTARDIAGPG